MEYEEVVPISSARDLDAKLRSEVRAFAMSWKRIITLIAEAKTRRIHEELGFKSWTAYIAAVISTEISAALVSQDRRQIVALLTEEGMSQRAIAEAVGVSNATVSRDQEALAVEGGVLHNVTPATVTSLSGETYPRPKPQPKPKPKPKPAPQPKPYACWVCHAQVQPPEDPNDATARSLREKQNCGQPECLHMWTLAWNIRETLDALKYLANEITYDHDEKEHAEIIGAVVKYRAALLNGIAQIRAATDYAEAVIIEAELLDRETEGN